MNNKYEKEIKLYNMTTNKDWENWFIQNFLDGDTEMKASILLSAEFAFEAVKGALDKQKEEIIEDLVSEFQMEGDYGKLTPFQQTVNTYIKNRGEEIINKIKEI